MSKVKHLALIKFKEGVSPEQQENAFQQIMDCTEVIPGIEDYVSGPNNSPEGLNEGYTHGFVMTFTDAAARDAYLVNPEHDKLKEAVLPLVDKVLILDFEV